LTSAVFYEGLVFFGSYDQNLYCVREGDGSLVWKFETAGHVLHASDIHKGVVFFPSFDNYLRAADAKSGKLIWKFAAGKYGLIVGPLIYKDVLYQASHEGLVYALTEEGKEIWSFRINHSLSALIIHKDRIYFGSEDENLYCLSLDGKKLWTFKTQGVVRWSPAAAGDRVYFPSIDCHLYCVGINTQKLLWKFRAQGEPSFFPPPFASFELTVKKRADDSGLEERIGGKRYSTMIDEEDGGKFYKSKVTYRMSSQYAAKGKYQKDSDEEAL
jgi:outer membrane protein assembly factor BamB